MESYRIEKLFRIICILGCLAAAQSGFAASFNCTKATTTVEKQISSDPTLSSLDDKLDVAYKKRIQRSLHPRKIKHEERVWLKHRNQCLKAECIAQAYRHRSAILSSPDKDVNQSSPYSLIMSQNNELCRGFLRAYEVVKLPNEHIKYILQPPFMRMKWKRYNSLLVPLSPQPLESAVFDIKNNGSKNLVIKIITTTPHSYEFQDSLFILPLHSDVISKLLSKRAGLSLLFTSRNIRNMLGYSIARGPHVLSKLTAAQIDKVISLMLNHMTYRQRKLINISQMRKNISYTAIGYAYVVDPFTWHHRTYIMMTDRFLHRQWIVVGKYIGKSKLEDLCYYFDSKVKTRFY